MTNSLLAVTTLVPLQLHLLNIYILDWLADPSPMLKGFTLEMPTTLRSFFRFALDIRQFQDHNRHG